MSRHFNGVKEQSLGLEAHNRNPVTPAEMLAELLKMKFSILYQESGKQQQLEISRFSLRRSDPTRLCVNLPVSEERENGGRRGHCR